MTYKADMDMMADAYQLARKKMREARERATHAERQLDQERQAALDVAISFWWELPPLTDADYRPSDSEIAEEWTKRMADRLTGGVEVDR